MIGNGGNRLYQLPENNNQQKEQEYEKIIQKQQNQIEELTNLVKQQVNHS